MGKIRSVNEFISASARYAHATVDKANANKNAYLTKAEAEKLPTDLKDNFANFRARGTTNGVVSKQKFLESYEAYVAATTLKADKNGNGILSATEAKTLPKDLQDNWANLWAAYDSKDASAALQTPRQRLDSLYNRQLPASNEFGELARRLDQELADGNIMTGVVGVASGKLANPKASDAELKTWATALMADYLSVTQDGAKASGVEAKTSQPRTALTEAGRIIAEGNAYDLSNADNVRSVIKGGDASDPDRVLGLEDLTKKLGTPVKCVVVKGKVADDNGNDQLNNVGMSVFVNTKTGEFIGFYGREGHV